MQNLLLSVIERPLKMSHAGSRCVPPHRSHPPGVLGDVAAAAAAALPAFGAAAAVVAEIFALPIGLFC